MITHRFSGDAPDPGLRVVPRSRTQTRKSSSGKLPMTVQDMEQWVKEHQLISLSIAALVGAAVGWMIKRR